MKLFDEFGNFVGDYTPRGGGIEGVVAAIGLIVVGFMFYTIYWIIKEWLKAFSKALENRNLGLALVCLIPPCAIGLLMVMTFVAILAGSAVQAAEQTRYTATRQAQGTQQAYAPTQTQEAIEQILNTVGRQIVADDVKIVANADLQPILEQSPAGFWFWYGESLQFTLSNNSFYQAKILFPNNPGSSYSCATAEDGFFGEKVFNPGVENVIYCEILFTSPELRHLVINIGITSWDYYPFENKIVFCRYQTAWGRCPEEDEGSKVIYLNP